MIFPPREWHRFYLYMYKCDGCGSFVFIPFFYNYTSPIIDLCLPKRPCKCRHEMLSISQGETAIFQPSGHSCKETLNNLSSSSSSSAEI